MCYPLLTMTRKVRNQEVFIRFNLKKEVFQNTSFLFYIFSKNHLISFPLCVTINYKIKQRIEYQGGKEK